MLKKSIIVNSVRLLLILIIVVISYRVIFYDILLIDTVMADFIGSIRCDWLDYVMKFVTSFGNTATIFVLLLVSIWGIIRILKNRKLAMFFFVGLISNVIINQGIKFLIRRNRPINSLIYVGGFSFPSGHAMVSMAFYGMLIYLFYKLIDNKIFKRILIISFGLLIFFIGFSWIYLGVHYLSDVLVGFSVSLLYLDVFSRILIKNKIFT